jgi:phosphoribosyl 1,2-cyclic phosphate phosphodiesterase
MAGQITILGCGSSGGVPRVGQGWGVCDPNEPKNRRRRCSILIEHAGQGAEAPTTILVDASPDLREQLLDCGTTHLDAVIITHEHADHTHGLDDLRPLTIAMRRRINVYTDRFTTDSLMQRFGYCFVTPQGSPYPPILRLTTVEAGKPLRLEGRGGAVDFDTFSLTHGELEVLGLRFNNVAYTPDVSHISDSARSQLENLDLWIIDALRPTPHPTHFSLPEALEWIERMKPKRAVLTNLHSDLDYAALRASLPAHITPAFDGMRLDFD